jgi:multimeric flavodoxin WrbA
MNVLVIGTTTHASNSSSWTINFLLPKFFPDSNFRFVDSDKLHIVKNLSCYSDGGKNCSSPDAGPYRCWAHHNSHQDPISFGGPDEMSIIYDGIKWADVVIFSTSVRWGSHSSLLQRVIERMNTLENRVSVYGETSPLSGKIAGVIVSGQHWKSQQVASHLIEVFSYMGFTTGPECSLSWQRTWDKNEEQLNSNDVHVLEDLQNDNFGPLRDFVSCLLNPLKSVVVNDRL